MSKTFLLKKAGITVTSVVLAVLLMCIACGSTPPALPLLDAIDQDNADVVRDHMESGIDPNKTFIPPGIPFAGASALHVAVLKDNREIVQLLLDNGAAIDIRALDDSKGSPLEWAAYFGLKDMAVFLVESGADINARNTYGSTPLDAAYANNPFIPEEDRNRFNANRDLISAYLIEKGAESTAPVLTLLDAIDQDNTNAVLAHLESGTNPDNIFIPPGLPFAGASALHVAVLKDNTEIVQILLDNGADIDIKALDEFKGSPLEWAAFFGIKEMAVFLVESGADINSKNAYGTTPPRRHLIRQPFHSRRGPQAVRRKSLLLKAIPLRKRRPVRTVNPSPYPPANSGMTSRAILSGISAVTSSGPDGLNMKCSTPASRYSCIRATICSGVPKSAYLRTI